MIRHIALFRFKSDTERASIDALMAGLEALPGDIPTILPFTRGENFSNCGQGHSHVVEMSFASRADLDGFYADPARAQLASALIKSNLDDLLIIDFEEVDTSPKDAGTARERAA